MICGRKTEKKKIANKLKSPAGKWKMSLQKLVTILNMYYNENEIKKVHNIIKNIHEM